MLVALFMPILDPQCPFFFLKLFNQAACGGSFDVKINFDAELSMGSFTICA